jgi:hypothetical protein
LCAIDGPLDDSLEELLGGVAEGEDVLDELLLEVLVRFALDDHADDEVEELQEVSVVIARVGEEGGFVETGVGHFEDLGEVIVQLLIQQFEASAWIGLH